MQRENENENENENEFIPNGLLSGKAALLAKVINQGRWPQAEARCSELLSHVQPNQTSEEHRNAVVTYLQCLIMKCVPCQVFTFGSVPLKTYLPDGDIDLTVFGDDEKLKDSLIREVLDNLESEEKNENAEYQVKEVQYIDAEVKIIKCMVENLVVDISFNQLGGLGTLCFLEEVDNLIKQNHLFKRSIMLIKSWCYYESRILGSHYGLLSTYALEVLVLYIFHVYSCTFAGPLEVLFRFLDFFSKFDWNNYCINLWGPVPIDSLPDMKAEPPRKDCKVLLFSESFLDACKSYYGVMPCQENKEKPFVSKYFNIVDPLRANNNLGRSISMGNFFRIRSALTLGAQRILRLLDCPEDNLIAEVDLFFKNTWDRNGNGYWIDTRSYNLYIKNNIKKSTSVASEVERAQASHGSHLELEESKPVFGTFDASAASQTWSSKNNDVFTSTMTSNVEHISSLKNALDNKGQDPTYSSNEVHDMHHSARFYTSPEFAHIHSEVPTEHWYTGVSERESGQIHSATSVIDNSSSSDVLNNQNTRIPSENQQSLGQISYDWRSEDAVGSEDTLTGYYYENGYLEEAMPRHLDEHDFPDFTGYLQVPMNADFSSNVSFPPSPSPVLALGYSHENSFQVLPVDVASYGHNMPYTEDLVPFPSFEWFPNSRTALYEEEIIEPVDYDVLGAHSDHERQVAVNCGSSSGNSSWQTGSRSYTPKEYAVTTEHNQLIREKEGADPPDEGIINSDVNSGASSSHTPASHSPLRTNLSSSSFSVGSSSKTSQPDGVSEDWICQSTADTGLCVNTTSETSYAQSLQLGGQMPMTVSNSSLADASLLVGSGSGWRDVENQSLLTVAYDSSGPSFQIPNMLPFYNLPAGTGTELGNLYTPESCIGLDYTQHSDAFHVNHINHDATSEHFAKESSDILSGDFTSYWMNLQYGRFCQNPQSQESFLNSPSVLASMPLRRQFPWYRRASGVTNIMGNRYPPVPVMPTRHASALHEDTNNQRVGFWLPRFSDGTGTFLPNPITYRQRYFRRKNYYRNQNENYRYERKDNHGVREENWNLKLKEKPSNRGQFYNRIEKKPGTNESSRQGEGSRGPFVKPAMRDSKYSPRQPSSSKIHGFQQVGRPANKRRC